MDDHDLVRQVDELAGEERALRLRAGAGHPLGPEDRERLAEIQVRIDQLWDLIRQRRAREEIGLDPDEVHERSPDVVEGYEQ